MTPKFRAWHKLHGEMREVYGITFNNEQKITSLLINGFQPGERSEFFWYQAMDETDKYDMGMKFEDLFVLLQNTGCRDKNGVEIYEGDIIKEDIEKGEPPIIVSVVWEKGAFYGKERKHEPEYIIQDFLNGEVIGNIYENPKLLED